MAVSKRNGVQVLYLGELKALRLKRDDVLVLTCEQHITLERYYEIDAEFKDCLRRRGIKNDCMVLAEGLKLSAVRPPKKKRARKT